MPTTRAPRAVTSGAVPALPTTSAAASVAARNYVVTPQESYPAAKAAAEAIALQITTYAAMATPASVADAVTADAPQRSALASALTGLVGVGESSRGTVIYPQMGGATADEVSVMVVVRQDLSGPAGSSSVTRTLDIWLSRAGATWRFARLDSTGGSPVARPATLSPLAAAVVDDARISLPDSARWDIYRGAISPTLLRLMLEIAQRVPYAVTVLESGHPFDVFGTTTESLHSVGRAVDINALAGTHVVALHGAGSSAHELAAWLLTQPEVTQVGSPWILDGGGFRSFTNAVHLDHLHVSV